MVACPTCRGTGKVRVQNQSTGEWETDACLDCVFIPATVKLDPEKLRGDTCKIVWIDEASTFTDEQLAELMAKHEKAVGPLVKK